MRQIHSDATLVPILRRIVAEDVLYHIFVNDITPNLDHTLASFGRPEDATYEPILVTAEQFALGAVTNHRGSVIAAVIDFTFSGGMSESAYGYFITDADDTVLLGAARFDNAPIALTAPLTLVSVLPIFGDVSKYAS